MLNVENRRFFSESRKETTAHANTLTTSGNGHSPPLGVAPMSGRESPLVQSAPRHVIAMRFAAVMRDDSPCTAVIPAGQTFEQST